MEQHLKNAITALRLAQEEILHPCELYSQLDDMAIEQERQEIEP